jgi:hypothetical protein
MEPGLKRLRLITIMAFLLVAGGSTVYWAWPPEPVYEGKTLSWWLRKYDADSNALGGPGPYASRLAESVRAIRAIGTNGTPVLLKLVSAKDLPEVIKLEQLVRKWGWKRFQITSAARKRTLGFRGFWVLGKEGRSAVPALLRIAQAGPIEARREALDWANFVNSGKEIVLPELMLLTTSTNSQTALAAAKKLIRLYPEEADKAGIYQKFPQLSLPVVKQRRTNAPAIR